MKKISIAEYIENIDSKNDNCVASNLDAEELLRTLQKTRKDGCYKIPSNEIVLT